MPVSKELCSFRVGVQCVICMCYVLYDSVASKGTARKQRVVERCDGRKEAYPGAVETPRLAGILRRLSVIGWRYHDQYAKATRSDKQTISLESVADIIA